MECIEVSMDVVPRPDAQTRQQRDDQRREQSDGHANRQSLVGSVQERALETVSPGDRDAFREV